MKAIRNKKYNNFILLVFLILNLLCFYFYLFIIRGTSFFNEKTDIRNGDKFLKIYFYSSNFNRSILVVTPENQKFLFDMSDKENVRNIVDDLIKEDTLFVKKFFYTRFYGKKFPMFDIFNNIIVNKVIKIVSFDKSLETDDILNYTKFHTEICYDVIEKNETIFLEQNLKINIFYPYDKFRSKNTGNAFILLTYKNLRFLFNYNNDYKDQYFLMQNYDFLNVINNYKINVVEYPRMLEGKSNVFLKFFKKINPDYVILNKMPDNQEKLDMKIFSIIPDFRIKRATKNLIKIKTDGYNIHF